MAQELQRMQPNKREGWLRETWGLEIEYSNPPASYPIEIVINGKRIGGTVRPGEFGRHGASGD